MEIVNPDFKIELSDLEFIGRGPLATGKNGWDRNEKFYYRCAKCGDIMKASEENFWNCGCNSMSLDIHGGRFGSILGDKNILVYRK